MTTDIAVIANPTAGRGRARRNLEKVVSTLQQNGFTYNLDFTRKDRSEATLAAALSGGIKRVIVVGGDGTIQQVVQEILGKNIPLGLIPVGSGNDFVKAFRIPRDVPSALKVALHGKEQSCDVGRIKFKDSGGSKENVSPRIFVNTIGIGIDGAIAYRSQRIQLLRGMPLYSLALIQTLIPYKPLEMRIDVDGEIYEGRYHLVTVGNGICEGGGFYVTPDADPSDGFFDVCLIKGVSKIHVFKILGAIMLRKHMNLPEVKIIRARKIKVSTPEQFVVHADGEILGTELTEIEVELMPRKLRVLTAGG